MTERSALPALVLLAALVRFPALAARGAFDADQGRDFLALRALLMDGTVPLLGPVASIGGFHHGAIYFYLLAAPAWLSGLDPPTVALVFALVGVLGVALVWWIARSVAGPAAGFVAGLVYALSPGAIAASTTIWNPNLVGTTMALALALAWLAWRSRRPAWWVGALAALGLTAALHSVSALPAVPALALLAADLRRTPAGVPRRALVRAIVIGAILGALCFLPLLIHELITGFGELRAIVAYLQATRAGESADPLSRLAIVTTRIASYPVTGLITEAPSAAIGVGAVTLALAAWLLTSARGDERLATGWLTLVVATTAVGLALLAPDAARVVVGLPNDHYHAATDPIVAILLGLGVGAMLRGDNARPNPDEPAVAVAGAASSSLRGRTTGLVVVAAVLLALVAVEVSRLPSADPNGGWPAALAAARRVAAATPAQTLLVEGLPDFKPTGELIFPLRQEGRDVIDGSRDAEGAQAPEMGRPASGDPGALVVVCDRLFEPVIGRACGGPAEDALSDPRFPRLIERFDLSSRTSVSVYGRAAVTPG